MYLIRKSRKELYEQQIANEKELYNDERQFNESIMPRDQVLCLGDKIFAHGYGSNRVYIHFLKLMKPRQLFFNDNHIDKIEIYIRILILLGRLLKKNNNKYKCILKEFAKQFNFSMSQVNNLEKDDVDSKMTYTLKLNKLSRYTPLLGDSVMYHIKGSSMYNTSKVEYVEKQILWLDIKYLKRAQYLLRYAKYCYKKQQELEKHEMIIFFNLNRKLNEYSFYSFPTENTKKHFTSLVTCFVDMLNKYYSTIMDKNSSFWKKYKHRYNKFNEKSRK